MTPKSSFMYHAGKKKETSNPLVQGVSHSADCKLVAQFLSVVATLWVSILLVSSQPPQSLFLGQEKKRADESFINRSRQ